MIPPVEELTSSPVEVAMITSPVPVSFTSVIVMIVPVSVMIGSLAVTRGIDSVSVSPAPVAVPSFTRVPELDSVSPMLPDPTSIPLLVSKSAGFSGIVGTAGSFGVLGVSMATGEFSDTEVLMSFVGRKFRTAKLATASMITPDAANKIFFFPTNTPSPPTLCADKSLAICHTSCIGAIFTELTASFSTGIELIISCSLVTHSMRVVSTGCETPGISTSSRSEEVFESGIS